MNTHLFNPPWRALLATAVAAAVTGQVAMSAPDTPQPAAPAASAQPESDANLDAQLQAARRKLEQDAKEVARLSTQMSGTLIDRVMPFDEGGDRAIIGVQLEPAAPGVAGARVREVSPGGPAAEAGIKTGDVIVAVNGTEIRGAEPAREVTRIMRGVKPDTKVSLRVLRDGSAREFTLTARRRPAMFAMRDLPDFDFSKWQPDFEGAFMFRGTLTDMELASLTPRLGSYFGSDKGVLVVRAPAGGALKLEDGDVILAIDGREPTSGSHATRILGSYQPGEKLTLRIMRQHKTQDLEATLPERAAGHHHHDMMYREVAPQALPVPPVPPAPRVVVGRGEV